MAAPQPDLRPGPGPETRPGSRPSWPAQVSGALILVAVGLQGAALAGPIVPDDRQILALQARLLESLAPQLLAVSLLLALAVAVLGFRCIGGALAFAAALGMVWLVADQARRAAPAGTSADLTVLWFNLLSVNQTPPDQLAAALIASQADVLMLSESVVLIPALGTLETVYPHRTGCRQDCEVTILSRLPFESGSIAGFERTGPERLLHARIRPDPDGQAVDLLAMHLLKPWYLGLAQSERDRLKWVLRRYGGPVVLAGDANAAPWSGPMRWLFRETGLKTAAAWPIATWPATAGALGVPIDHVLVRGGLGITSIRPWGTRLGSNHRGLLAVLDVPSPLHRPETTP